MVGRSDNMSPRLIHGYCNFSPVTAGRGESLCYSRVIHIHHGDSDAMVRDLDRQDNSARGCAVLGGRHCSISGGGARDAVYRGHVTDPAPNTPPRRGHRAVWKARDNTRLSIRTVSNKRFSAECLPSWQESSWNRRCDLPMFESIFGLRSEHSFSEDET